MTKKSPASEIARFETHEHVFVTGPRRGARLVVVARTPFPPPAYTSPEQAP